MQDKTQTPLDQALVSKTDEQIALEALEKFTTDYIIPEEKVELISNYIGQLRLKNPQMKSDRLFRKVAEYFRLKKNIITE